MKKIILCFVVLVLVYIGINSFNNFDNEENYGDKVISFNEKTILGKKLVLKNNISTERENNGFSNIFS